MACISTSYIFYRQKYLQRIAFVYLYVSGVFFPIGLFPRLLICYYLLVSHYCWFSHLSFYFFLCLSFLSHPIRFFFFSFQRVRVNLWTSACGTAGGAGQKGWDEVEFVWTTRGAGLVSAVCKSTISSLSEVLLSLCLCLCERVCLFHCVFS